MSLSRFNVEPVTAISIAGNIALAGLGWFSMNKTKEARYQARHDALTGALNRYGLEHVLNDKHPPVAMLYVDGTNQKGVNDNLGHQRGDEAIVGTFQVLEESLRPGDVIARIGGDEFLVALDAKQRRIKTPLSPEAVLHPVTSRIAERSHAFVTANPDLQAHGFDIAVGGVVWDGHMSIVDMEEAAEASMYVTKDAQHQANGKHR